MAPYLLVDGPEEVDLICETLQLGLKLHFIHVGLIHILLDEDEIVLTLCAPVDFVFIPGKNSTRASQATTLVETTNLPTNTTTWRRNRSGPFYNCRSTVTGLDWQAVCLCREKQQCLFAPLLEREQSCLHVCFLITQPDSQHLPLGGTSGLSVTVSRLWHSNNLCACWNYSVQLAS